MTQTRAWAARAPGGKLERYTYEAGPLGGEEVEIAVEHCGLCHSDLSMIDNDWGFSTYPLVPGHEAVGRIVAMGDQVKGLRHGQRAGGGGAGDPRHLFPQSGRHRGRRHQSDEGLRA